MLYHPEVCFVRLLQHCLFSDANSDRSFRNHWRSSMTWFSGVTQSLMCPQCFSCCLMCLIILYTCTIFVSCVHFSLFVVPPHYSVKHLPELKFPLHGKGSFDLQREQVIRQVYERPFSMRELERPDRKSKRQTC